MVKRVLSVVVALVVAFAIIMAFEAADGALFKTPEIDPRNPKTVSDMMASMPLAAFLWLLLGYSISALAGGVVATLLSGRANVQAALTVAGALTVGAIMNLISIPGHPVWFVVVNVLIFVPFAWVGFLLAKKKPAEN